MGSNKKSREGNIKRYLKDIFNKNFQIKPLDKTGKFPIDIDIGKKEVLVFKGHPVFKKKEEKRKRFARRGAYFIRNILP